MQLSGTQFKQIIEQLNGAANDNSGKRKNPRVGLRKIVVITQIGPDNKIGASLQVTARDLSATGIGLLSLQPMAADSHFAIRLPIAGGKDMLAVYIVKHCDAIEDSDTFRVGAHLAQLHDPAAKSGAAAAIKPKEAAAAKADEKGEEKKEAETGAKIVEKPAAAPAATAPPAAPVPKATAA